MTLMRKTFLVLTFLIFSFPAFCLSSNDMAFQCHSEDFVWRVEKEKGKEVFAFWYKDRLVAFRHLLWVEDQFFTNNYDLDFRVTFEQGLQKGHLTGRLMGKSWVLKNLICQGLSKR